MLKRGGNRARRKRMCGKLVTGIRHGPAPFGQKVNPFRPVPFKRNGAKNGSTLRPVPFKRYGTDSGTDHIEPGLLKRG